MEKESRATKRSRPEKFRHAYNEAQLLKHQYNSKTQQHLHRGLSSPDLGKSPIRGWQTVRGKIAAREGKSGLSNNTVLNNKQ
jgi:hypothetical protein